MGLFKKRIYQNYGIYCTTINANIPSNLKHKYTSNNIDDINV